MKKVLFILPLCFAIFFCSGVYAAEYVVKKDECLSIIAKKINISAGDLTTFNYLPDSDLIFPGQVIHYVSEDDLKKAKAWAARNVDVLYTAGIDHEFFKSIIKYINAERIVYSTEETDGAFAGVILQYAAAWNHFIE